MNENFEETYEINTSGTEVLDSVFLSEDGTETYEMVEASTEVPSGNAIPSYNSYEVYIFFLIGFAVIFLLLTRLEK